MGNVITINNVEELDQYKTINEQGSLTFDGSLVLNIDLTVCKNLTVTGSIDTSKDIYVGRHLKVGGNIVNVNKLDVCSMSVHGSVNASNIVAFNTIDCESLSSENNICCLGGYIRVTKDIVAKNMIEVRGFILAGGDVKAVNDILVEDLIRIGGLLSSKTGVICCGRHIEANGGILSQGIQTNQMEFARIMKNKGHH